MEFSQRYIDKFNEYLLQHQPQLSEDVPDSVNRLVESMQYSLKTGGKRFRPTLALLTAESLNKPLEKAMPVALAVEYIHSYSLIHDDLPVMDDDDLRRGQPTNHKVFGEAMALLAGDALLTESFRHLAKNCSPAVSAQVIDLVAEASGWCGMVGGQAVDIEKSKNIKKEWIEYIHDNKTGALIRVSVEAAAVACGAEASQVRALREFGQLLGFAFQLADDILDWNPEAPENTSYVCVYGLDETKRSLREVSSKCFRALKENNVPTEFFNPLIQFNLERDK